MGNGRILPLVASKDILHPENLRADACGGSWEKLKLTTRLVILRVRRDWDTGGGPQADKGGNLRSSQVQGWRETRPSRGTSEAARLRNLRRWNVEGSVAAQAEEPPEWPGRGTSGRARLRNLRQRSVEGSAAERRIQASDQLKPRQGTHVGFEVWNYTNGLGFSRLIWEYTGIFPHRHGAFL